jgi:hypothetical protein
MFFKSQEKFTQMNNKRQDELFYNNSLLTEEESNQGWHFCKEFENLLVGPNMTAAFFCPCNHAPLEAWKDSEEGQKAEEVLATQTMMLNTTIRMDQEDDLFNFDKEEADFNNTKFKQSDGE